MDVALKTLHPDKITQGEQVLYCSPESCGLYCSVLYTPESSIFLVGTDAAML